nr:unnamed protein product [Digitaria exilis]
MAEIGGMLAGGVLKLVAGKVAEAAGDRLMLQWRFGEDLEGMKLTAESIQAVLEDAERKSLADKPVQLWLERLTRASYDIADMFDEFEVETTSKSALRKFKVLKPCLTLPSEVRMAGKMKVVREKLDIISKERDKYSLATSNSNNVQQVMNDRATSPEVIQAEILGRDEEKQKLVALFSSSSEFIVLPIYGIGGIGKTTLAQMLFNDTHFSSYEKAWVYVSQTFDLTKIKETIRSQLQLDKDAGPSAPKSILIVLDDLWEEDDFKLDDLKKSLKIIGNNGHKVHVIVTTRGAGIAKKVQTSVAYNIQALSVDVCWDIIKQRASFENRFDKERFEFIGKEIAEKCGGVALAARAIGYILRSKSDLHEWVSVKESGIWNVSSSGSSSDDRVLASLKLSYSSMPSYLRLCFAYCAIFPKGHKMAKDELIYQWAALGFIMPSDGTSIQQHGEAYINQLLDMSFFHHSWTYRKYVTFGEEKGRKDITFFTMHDLVYDLARSVMGDELLDAREEFSKREGSSFRYAFLADCRKPLNSYVTSPNKIRALYLLGSGSTEHCSIGFSTARYLKSLGFRSKFLKEVAIFYWSTESVEELPKDLGGEGSSLKYLIGCICETIPSNKSLIPLPKFAVRDVEGEQSSNLILLKDAYNPIELEVHCLENVKSTEEARMIELKAKQSLEELTISNMENLEEWDTTYSHGEGIAEEFVFPNLEELKIIGCPKLRLKPCPPKVVFYVRCRGRAKGELRVAGHGVDAV